MRIKVNQVRNKYNSGKLPKNNVPELAKRKQELLKQAVKRSQNKKPVVQPVANEGTISNDVKKLRKQLDAYASQIKTLQAQNNKLNQRYKAEKQTNHRLRSDHKGSRSAIKKAQQDIKSLELKQQKLLKEIADKNAEKEELNNWFIKNDIESVKDFQKYAGKLIEQIYLMSMLYQIQAKQSNILAWKLRGQIKANATLQKNTTLNRQEIDSLKREKNTFDKKISQHNKKIQELRTANEVKTHFEDVAPNVMLDLLIERCNEDNFDYYDDVDKLIAKYQTVLNRLLKQRSTDWRYGYIEFDEGHCYLHDVNRADEIEVYVDPRLFMDPNLASGATVRCHKTDDDLWLVEKIYRSYNGSLKTIVNRKRRQKSTKHMQNDHKIVLTDSDELVWLKDKKVLVVGNKFSSGFIDELKKYCQLKVMDGYEDGLHHIYNTMDTSDYVFLLIGSVPHNITEHTENTEGLQKDSPKVQIFDVPAKYDGVVRLHYLYVNRQR